MANRGPYRLGLDISANAIGWCLIALNGKNAPTKVIDLGTRVLTASDEAGRDPQTGASLAVERRVARGMRRRRDRQQLRKSDLIQALISIGLMPDEEAKRKELESLDPYQIRVAALDGPVPITHLGRALFHLHQRRGFKSNRKSDAGAAETSLIREGVENLRVSMKKTRSRTIGEYLANQKKVGGSTKARIVGAGREEYFPFYLDRALIEDEFNTLWTAQTPYHTSLTDSAREELHSIMFRQRPLRPVIAGKCALYPKTDYRAPRALPIAQKFRILKELAHLSLRSPGAAARPLTMAERDILLDKLSKTRKLTFDQIRRVLKVNTDTRFNIESEHRRDLKGDETAYRLASKKIIGKEWYKINIETQNIIVENLIYENDEEFLRENMNLILNSKTEFIDPLINAPALVSGHVRYGFRALSELVDIMIKHECKHVCSDTGETMMRPIREDEAIITLGHHPLDRQFTERLERLPRYGAILADAVVGTGDPDDPEEKRLGTLPNPTIHIAFNQLRRLVNAIIGRYGRPKEIALELAPELKMGREEKARSERKYNQSRIDNEERKSLLDKLKKADTGTNRLILRLYDELPTNDKICVYSGKNIGIDCLFSPDIEVGHILPFSKTLDDSIANKVLCFRDSHKGKRGRSPDEAFSTEQIFMIHERANRILPPHKANRFAPGAMQRFATGGNQLPQRLTDTHYIARLAKQYLGVICEPNGVWVTNGRLTSLLRGKWGLNSLLPDHNFASTAQRKNRLDHRHSAIDAFVVAVTDQFLIDGISQAAEKAEEQGLGRVLSDIPDPFMNFRIDLEHYLAQTVVSHRPDHGLTGKLHEETAYGPVTESERSEGWTVAYRRPIGSLTANEIRRIRAPDLREMAVRLLESEGEAAVRLYFEGQGIRRIRLLKREDPEGLVKIRHGSDGEHVKLYAAGNNHHVDIFEDQDGRWRGTGVSVYAANNPSRSPQGREHSMRLVMRLHKGDLVEVEYAGVRQIMRVYRLEPSNNRIRLANHTETGALDKRHKEPSDPFRWFLAGYSTLKSGGARRVRIDELGRVHPTTDI